MADGRVDQVHLADLALVLLLRRDLLRVGRPRHHRAVAAAPAGVVGGVAEVLRRRRSSARFSSPLFMSRTQRFQLRMKTRARAVGRHRQRLAIGRLAARRHALRARVLHVRRRAGRCTPSQSTAAAAQSEKAVRAFFNGSTTTISVLFMVWLRYQKRSSGSQVASSRAANDESLQIGSEKPLGACVILSGQGRPLSGKWERRNNRSEEWQTQTHFHAR